MVVSGYRPACVLLIPAMQKDHTFTRTGPLNITLLTPEPIAKPFVEEAATKKTELPAIKNKTITPDGPPQPELANLEQAEPQADQKPPGKTEIVDRWLAADGSQNVVINTPGHTLCGRLLAWDPMQPLIEHVVQYRPCGGGGKRVLEMTQRIKRLNSSPL